MKNLLKIALQPFTSIKELQDAKNEISNLTNELMFLKSAKNSELEFYRNAERKGQLMHCPCSLGSTIYTIIPISISNTYNLSAYMVASYYTELTKNIGLFAFTVDQFIYKNNKLYIAVREIDYFKTGYLIEAEDNIFIELSDAVDRLFNGYKLNTNLNNETIVIYQI